MAHKVVNPVSGVPPPGGWGRFSSIDERPIGSLPLSAGWGGAGKGRHVAFNPRYATSTWDGPVRNCRRVIRQLVGNDIYFSPPGEK
jgi:hypothetical protein